MQRRARSFVDYDNEARPGVLVNSILSGHGTIEPEVYVEHSELAGNFHLERWVEFNNGAAKLCFAQLGVTVSSLPCRGSLCSGVRSLSGLHLRTGLVLQEITLHAELIADHPVYSRLIPHSHAGRVVVIAGAHSVIDSVDSLCDYDQAPAPWQLQGPLMIIAHGWQCCLEWRIGSRRRVTGQLLLPSVSLQPLYCSSVEVG